MDFLFHRLIRILFPAWCTSGTTRPQLRSSRPWLCPSRCPVPADRTSSSAQSTLTSLWRTVQNMSAWQSTTGERSSWKMFTLWQISLFTSYFYTIFRLHEFDEQVSAVREGMARIVPVPLLSLFTGYELETMVRIEWIDIILQAVLACLTVFLSSGLRKSRHPSPLAEIGGDLQGGGANIAAHPVVLEGHGIFLQHREVAFSEVCLGSHSPAPHHCWLPWAGFCCTGKHTIINSIYPYM